MAAVDKQLAAMLRLRMEQAGAKKEQKQQQLHFKLRVLDLLDALSRRHAPPATLVLLPLQLVKVMISCAARPSETAMSAPASLSGRVAQGGVIAERAARTACVNSLFMLRTFMDVRQRKSRAQATHRVARLGLTHI